MQHQQQAGEPVTVAALRGQTVPTPGSQRLQGIDAVRGLVMVVMALDHVRDMLHRGAITGSPTDLATTTPLLFFTRWITHFCAPLFMLTAGIGAYLWWRDGHSRRELSWFLATRGLWLVVLELTVMRFAYNFTVSAQYPLMLLVLWALGLSMLALAAVAWMPVPVIGGLSLATIVLHNLLDPIRARQLGDLAGVWNLLHEVGAFPIAGTVAIVGYPLVPWVAVMALGFALGPLFARRSEARQRTLLAGGLGAVLAFVALRGLASYGDPVRWVQMHSAAYTAMAFINTTKYPPSLAFLLMTLGPGLLLLAWFERLHLAPTHPLVVLGRVPLFYFVAHFYAAHATAALLALVRYGSAAWSFIFHPVPTMGGPAALYPRDFGYDLWVIYLAWAGIVVALYPACRWFAGVKARRRDWWLRYL